MTVATIDPGDDDRRDDAEILPFEKHRKRVADSFEHELDVEPDATPVPVDPVVKPPAIERRPIIPEHLKLGNLRATAVYELGRVGHIAGYHGVRAWWYALLALFWGLVGVFKLGLRQIVWMWQPSADRLEQSAADADDYDHYLKIRRDTRPVRVFRFFVLLGSYVAAVIAFTVLYLNNRVGFWIVAVIGLWLASMAGHPKDRPIISSAVVKPRYRKLRADIVLRAYYAAKLGNPDKEDQVIMFGGPMHRDATNTGSQVVVDLPYGSTFKKVVDAKASIASGLDVSVLQVYFTKDRTSERRHLLYVADQDPLAIPAGKTPMLDLKPRNIWRAGWFGLDERGQRVKILMMWLSFLIGAQPRKGKTFTGRLLALYAALDPYVRLDIVDGKLSPDWRIFRLIAHTMIFGTRPAVEDGQWTDPIEKFLNLLREYRKHIDRVNQTLSEIARKDPSAVPEGKLTEALARDPRYPDLRVRVLVVEEFQVYFETEDQDTNKEIAGHLADIQSRGPSAGVIVVSLSQKPLGVGAGDVTRLFNRYRDNHTARIALKCGSRDVSIAILGGDAYGEGYDASSLPTGEEYRGLGFLYGIADHVPLTRWHLATGPDCERILIAARAHRERAGTLGGEAAGDVVVDAELVDPITDALAAMLPTERNISWERLAARLREQFPQRYADVTADAVSARIRGAGIKGKPVKDKDFYPSGVGQGVARQDLEQAAIRRGLR